ncbi:MAG: molybdopterin-dependent oxidoreductase, partial [Deltaproteobacteria bacterium]|nr:molybdopterin-dependent oxidoreductase [Deltaproteobacteria bacterium]
MPVISRRTFLLGAGAAGVSLGLYRLSLGSKSQSPSPMGESPKQPGIAAYNDWRDVYRNKFTWDSISKGTHHVNCWYQRGCNWNVYVKDGIVFREEQVADYEQTNSDVPDYNPRGCQKGAVYSQRLYDGSRIRYPMKRVGKRGEGKWKRITWDEGLREVADATIDALVEDGPASITWDPGTANSNGCNGLGGHRTGYILDTPLLDVNCEVGDHHPGAMATMGKISFASSGDDLFYSDLILIWGGNPAYTQIPNVHFINEARYHGAHIVSIVPDFNASTMHTDEWISVDVGSDAAFGLSMSQVIIEEGLYDKAFITEQTDMPLLVRKDNKLFLRQSDIKKNGAEDVFYVYDETAEEVREADKKTLAIEGFSPALEGAYKVDTLDGEVECTTVFELLRTQLADYVPEDVEKITGVSPKQTRGMARRIAKAKAATVITNSNFSKFYHGLEMERAQILVMSLCGQIGKPGAGFNAFPAMTIAGATTAIMTSGSLSPKMGSMLLSAQMAPEFIQYKLDGLTDEMAVYELTRNVYREGGHVSGMLFYYFQGGLDELYGSANTYDPSLKRPVSEYIKEAIDKGWQIIDTEAKPRIFFEVGGNILRRTRGYDRLIENFLPKLDLLVTVDWRMSTTALHSDFVFPAASWYERDDITYATPIAPFAHVTTAATPPFAESKPDWEFHCLFLKMVQQRAIERNILTYKKRSGEETRLDDVYDRFTFGGRFTENNMEELLEQLMQLTTNLGGISWEEIKKKGYARYTSLDLDFVNIGNATDIEPDKTITANTWHTQKKIPWPTLTRRAQFYIDHPFYLELGEELPVHKEPPAIGGNYPLKMTGQHARWSIHSSWRDETTLLNLQRGEPVIIMSVEDAEARGLKDGDRARAFNDLGSFETAVKVSGTLHKEQVIINHGWEAYQFKDHKSYNSIIPSPINPISLAGGYFHLQPTPLYGEPGSNDRGTRME